MGSSYRSHRTPVNRERTGFDLPFKMAHQFALPNPAVDRFPFQYLCQPSEGARIFTFNCLQLLTTDRIPKALSRRNGPSSAKQTTALGRIPTRSEIEGRGGKHTRTTPRTRRLDTTHRHTYAEFDRSTTPQGPAGRFRISNSSNAPGITAGARSSLDQPRTYGKDAPDLDDGGSRRHWDQRRSSRAGGGPTTGVPIGRR